MIGLDLLDISVVAWRKLEFGIIVVNYISCLKVAIFLYEWMWESWHCILRQSYWSWIFFEMHNILAINFEFKV